MAYHRWIFGTRRIRIHPPGDRTRRDIPAHRSWENRMQSAYPAPGPEEVSRPDAASESEPLNGAPPNPTPAEASWKVFLAMGVTSGVFFGLFWSLWMWKSVWSKRELVDILTGPGAGGGLFFGTLFGAFMAFLMRPGTITLPIGHEDAFLPRLYGEMKKMRYQPLGRSEGLRNFGPKTLYRPSAFNIQVRLEDGTAIVTGPKANIKALKK
jgi:hypothetical protein